MAEPRDAIFGGTEGANNEEGNRNSRPGEAASGMRREDANADAPSAPSSAPSSREEAAEEASVSDHIIDEGADNTAAEKECVGRDERDAHDETARAAEVLESDSPTTGSGAGASEAEEYEMSATDNSGAEAAGYPRPMPWPGAQHVASSIDKRSAKKKSRSSPLPSSITEEAAATDWLSCPNPRPGARHVASSIEERSARKEGKTSSPPPREGDVREEEEAEDAVSGTVIGPPPVRPGAHFVAASVDERSARKKGNASPLPPSPPSDNCKESKTNWLDRKGAICSGGGYVSPKDGRNQQRKQIHGLLPAAEEDRCKEAEERRADKSATVGGEGQSLSICSILTDGTRISPLANSEWLPNQVVSHEGRGSLLQLDNDGSMQPTPENGVRCDESFGLPLAVPGSEHCDNPAAPPPPLFPSVGLSLDLEVSEPDWSPRGGSGSRFSDPPSARNSLEEEDPLEIIPPSDSPGSSAQVMRTADSSALIGHSDTVPVDSERGGHRGEDGPVLHASLSDPISAHVIEERLPTTAAAFLRAYGDGEGRAHSQGLTSERQPSLVVEGRVLPSPRRKEPAMAECSYCCGLQIRARGRAVVAFSVIAAAVIIVCITVPVLLTKSADGVGDLTPSNIETDMGVDNNTTERFRLIKAKLAKLIPNPATLELTSSPQRRALNWLADVDGRQVEVRDSRSITQRFSLATVYFATGGVDSWEKSCNFLSQEHECQWNEDSGKYNYWWGPDTYSIGAICHGHSQTVTDLILRANKLKGTVPEEVILLSELQMLYLNLNNDLTSTIPSSLRYLTSLQELDLSHNQISGSIPSSMGEMVSLGYLNANDNFLTGSIPNEINSLDSLFLLALSFNPINGTLPFKEGYKYLPHLEILTLFATDISGTLPADMGTFSEAKTIIIQGSNMHGTIPEEIGKVSGLEILSFWGSNLSGTIPESIADIRSLQMLGLGHNHLDGTLPSGVVSLPHLSALSVEENRMTGTVPSAIGLLGNMVGLSLRANKFTGPIPPSIGNQPNMLLLDLGDNQFTGEVPQSFQDMDKLVFFSVARNNLNGTLKHVCDSFSGDVIRLVYADCAGPDPEIGCECCKFGCCEDGNKCDAAFHTESYIKNCAHFSDCFGAEEFIDIIEPAD